MRHLVAFGSSIANSGVLLQLNQIADNVLPQSNNGILIPARFKGVAAVWAVGAHLVRAQLVAPSLRDLGNQDLEPINVGTAFESPVRGAVYVPAPLPLSPPEELDMFAAQTGAGAETDYAGVLLDDAAFVPFAGRILQAHWTASKTLVAGAWTTLQPILDNPLAQGRYAVIGAHVKSATGLFFRCVPFGENAGRPGGICVQAVDQLEPEGQRKGGWGQWFQFDNTTIPNVDILATAADTSEEGVFDLVKL